MQVVIDGTKINLKQADQLGAGGEGTVYKSNLHGKPVAVKIYHKPSTERKTKLEAFVRKSWTIPVSKIALPQQLVYESKGQNVVGLTMPLLDSGFEELASLANKKYRASFLINTRTVSEIFLNGWETIDAIHKNGLVIGDFNDLNGLFRGAEMLFIDVDAWQFDRFPCPVGTEQFLAPELYGVDLSTRPYFKPEHDWYSYAVMLFKSLLLVHPFGGTHKDIKQLTTRATRRITVFAPHVIYPKIALAPDVLNDDLANVFEGIFSRGNREKFPHDVLRSYADSLIECKSCGAFYPSSRKQCPVCSAQTMVIFTKPVSVTKGVKTTEFIRTNGKIVFHKVVGTTIYVVAYEQGKAVLYIKSGTLSPSRYPLFKEISGARYDIFGQKLIVNLPNDIELLLFDLSGDTVKPMMKSETAIFAGNRRAMFRTSDAYLFRLVSGNMMYGQVENGQLIERYFRPVMADQTWFAVKQESLGEKPTACGFFQVMHQQMFWLNWEGRSYDNLQISELVLGESLVDLSVKFSSQGVSIRRLTILGGVNYIHTDMVNTDGKVVFSSGKIRLEDHPAPYLHGQAYSTGKLLSATDQGVVSEDIQTGQVKTFDATKGVVEEGDSLYSHQGGLLVVKDTSIIHIVLG